jgi:hypothetical protein
MAMTPCLLNAVHRWLRDESTASTCGTRLKLSPLPAFPTQMLPDARYTQGRTLDLAGVTLQEAETTWLMLSFEGRRAIDITGLDGGTLKSSRLKLVLHRYSLTPGLSVSGTLHASEQRGRLAFTGPVTIGGLAAAPGARFEDAHPAPVAALSGLAPGESAALAVADLARG